MIEGISSILSLGSAMMDPRKLVDTVSLAVLPLRKIAGRKGRRPSSSELSTARIFARVSVSRTVSSSVSVSQAAVADGGTASSTACGASATGDS